jgi:hypothetical protein
VADVVAKGRRQIRMRLRGCCMSGPAAGTLSPAAKAPGLAIVVSTLGVTQILAWGSSYYLLAVLAQPIARDTGWPLGWVVGDCPSACLRPASHRRASATAFSTAAGVRSSR